MQKRAVTLAVLLVLALGLTPFTFAQLGIQAPSPHRVLGYFNPDTGMFEPLRLTGQESSGDVADVTPTTGTLVFDFTITLKTALPKNGMLICTAGGDVIETSFSADEASFGFAKLVSGSTYSCTVSLPYSWLLNTPTTDKIILSYKAQIIEAVELTATNGTGTTVFETAGRASSQTTASIPMPANGVTTTKDVAVTL